MGAKPKLITPEIIAEVRKFASLGMTKLQIATYYGFSKDQWELREKKHPEIPAMYDKGKAEGNNFVMGKLREHIEKGNLTAIIFYLKTQCRWRETDRPGEGEPDKPPIQSFTLTTTDPVAAAKIYQRIMTET